MTEEVFLDFIDNPHRLGHVIGFTKLSDIHSHWIKFLWYPEEYFKRNGNWKKTVKFFNKLGETFDIEDENGNPKRIKLTKKIFFELLGNQRSLMGHRGSYKSTAILIVGAIVRLLLEPDIRIGIIRKDFTKAALILKNISDLMKKRMVKELFKYKHKFYPKAVKNRDNILTFNFKSTITAQGNVNAYGIHASITGDHLDFTLFDDFVTIDDKISRAEREKTKVRIEEVRANVLDPGKQAAFIGTTWHKDDAWQDCPPALKFDVYMAKIFDKDTIQEKRDLTTNITFSANYELRHVSSEDALFKDPHWGNWEGEYKNGIGVLDKKYWGKDTNALFFASKKRNGRYQGIGFTFHENIKVKIPFVKTKWLKYKIGTIWSEDNDDKGFVSDKLTENGVLADTYHENTNKHVKIENNLLENGFWELIDWDINTDPEFINQILDYTEGQEPDDAPDCTAVAGRILITSKSSVHADRWKHMREKK